MARYRFVNFTARARRASWIAVAAALVTLAVCLSWWMRPGELPRFEAVRAAHNRTEAALLDRHNAIIHEVRVDPSARRLDWVALAEISPALQTAIIAAEDKRFFSHRGVDWTSMGSAVAGALRRGGSRGASTITMQLASILDEDLRAGASRRSIFQKLRQIRAARALEAGWSKPQILEAYLNLVSFRGELQGIGAAAAGLFGKSPHGIEDLEAVILAALIRAPNASPDQVGSRAAALASTLRLGYGGPELIGKAREILGHTYFIRPRADFAPHVMQRLLRDSQNPHAANLRVSSTLDGSLQRFALEALRHHIASLASQNVHDGAVLAVENQTGEVLAYVGNSGESASARHVDGVQAQRQAGSTLKPFIYGMAFERRLLTPASLIDDSPLDVPVFGGVYRPSNYDRHFHGPVTARSALAASLNVPAVKTLNLVGVEPAVGLLGRLGFEDLRSPDYYGPSLALGSADVRLWDLVNAYRTLANSGIYNSLRLSPADPEGPPRRALAEAAAFLISDILADREGRSITFSLESPLTTRFWTAVKTGTSKDMRDNWCIGYSSRYTVGVWAGNFTGDPMWNVSGVSGAAPVWVEIMNRLHRDVPSVAPVPPAEVVEKTIALAGSKGQRREWFARGTETEAVVPAPAGVSPRIVYPAGGTVIALDPDIPDDLQKLFFESSAGSGELQWKLNDCPLGPADSIFLWTPARGRYSLALVDRSGRTIDSVDFEVRGREKKSKTSPGRRGS